MMGYKTKRLTRTKKPNCVFSSFRSLNRIPTFHRKAGGDVIPRVESQGLKDLNTLLSTLIAALLQECVDHICAFNVRNYSGGHQFLHRWYKRCFLDGSAVAGIRVELAAAGG